MSQAKFKPTAIMPRWQQRLSGHSWAAKWCWQELCRAPFASLMTILVIGITLTLPADLELFLHNLYSASQGWHKSTQISLYLAPNIEATSLAHLRRDLTLRDDVANVEYISPQQGLAEFKQRSGFGDVVNLLPHNPLPGVLLIYPDADVRTPEHMAHLLADLQQLPHVELAQMDLAWLQKLSYLLALGQRIGWILFSLFSIAVLLIVGNTIRLAISNQHETISVQQLIGATDEYIRRPFLYFGAVHGLLGGCAAIIFLECQVAFLQQPFTALMLSYSSEKTLTGLTPGFMLSLLVLSACLGLVAARVVAGQQIRSLHPE